jgi:hypothetical protein
MHSEKWLLCLCNALTHKHIFTDLLNKLRVSYAYFISSMVRLFFGVWWFLIHVKYNFGCKAQPQSKERPQACTATRAHVSWIINAKMCTSHRAADANTCPENGCDRSTTLSSTDARKLQPSFFLFFFGPTSFLFACSTQTPWPILTLNNSEIVYYRKKLLFVCLHCFRSLFWGHIP